MFGVILPGLRTGCSILTLYHNQRIRVWEDKCG